MSRNGKVLVAMSGGIDSTVTAILLHEAGYEVVGMTMKTWDYATAGGSKKETGCCSLDSINDARAVAVDMGFHHFIVDIREEFGDWVINNFVEEYLAGRTPNPCIMCNTHIKWAALLKRADALDCEFMATGHYAQKRYQNDRYIISKGIDSNKDQSYVLWGLDQHKLARTLFPIGGFHKPDIRRIAAERGYDELAKKAESYEICFIPDNDYRSFLARRQPEAVAKLKGGNFVATDGTILGQHDGYPFYTIGQRKGLGIALGKPLFVTNIDANTNTVVLGEVDDLQQQSMWVGNLNFVKYPDLYEGADTVTKIRSRHQGTPAFAQQFDQRIRVDFFQAVDAVAPGQSAVMYEGDDVIAGGHILTTIEQH